MARCLQRLENLLVGHAALDARRFGTLRRWIPAAKLTYSADLQPQFRGGPSWAHGAMRDPAATISTEGVALFDMGHKHLVSNAFSYDGLLHLPIKDLGRIPWELRIGRRVKGQAGEIMIRFENKIDIRKN